MANTHNYMDHFPQRANMRVPSMSYAADVDRNGVVRMELGTPIALDADGIWAALSINDALVKSTATKAAAYARSAMGRWGRNVTIVLSGAGTPAVTIYGRDYLGQPMCETLTGSGTTPVLGVKCFAHVDSISSDAVTSTTINVGWGNKLGFPYAVGVITDALVDGITEPSAGTKTVAVLTDPQTATTGDPRGGYLPHSSYLPNGSRDYVILGIAVEGNYHGVAQFTN